MVQITLVVVEVSQNFGLKTANQIKSRTRKEMKESYNLLLQNRQPPQAKNEISE